MNGVPLGRAESRGRSGRRTSRCSRILLAGRTAAALALAALTLSCASGVSGPAPAGPLDGFMFHVFDPGHRELLGSDYAADLKADLEESLAWTAPPYFWDSLEPVDNQFDWTELDRFVSDFSDRHRVMNLGPELVPAGGGDFYVAGELPAWVENSIGNPELRIQYGEFVSAIVERYRDETDMWWIGLEVNLGGDGLSWDEWRDWLAWQVGIMRDGDPDARIAVSFGSWEGYHEPIPANAIHEVDGALELVAEGVDFDVIAIEYHHGTLQSGGIDEMVAALDDLKSVGKDIFIWEVFYPAETDTLFQQHWSWVEAPPGGYTEDWQAEMCVATLRAAYEDPQVIGLNVLHFQDITYDDIDPTDWEAGWRCHAGFVRSDATPRRAYDDVRNLWFSLRR